MLKTKEKDSPASGNQTAATKAAEAPSTESPHGIPDHVLALLPVMLEARQYADALLRDPWDFAIELPMLCAMGFSISDLRWLTYLGYIQAAEELLPAACAERTFRLEGTYSFTQETCFILTDAGQAATQAAIAAGQAPNRPGNSSPVLRHQAGPGTIARSASRPRSVGHGPSVEVVPQWDPERRELWIAGTLVKQFKLPSPNQEAVLSAFEEEGWPKRIDDPLSRVGDLDPKQRLHDTIKSLNRHQKTQSLKFAGDGRGEGVLWEALPKRNGRD